MVLTLWDWLVIGGYLSASIVLGLWAGRNAGRSLEQYFLSGRETGWLLAGLSMVATTFAADTPLFVAETVRQKGISGNWIWWNMLIGGMMTTFFFAKLWQRSGVTTDVELVTIRYSGKAVIWLRTLKAIYFGLFMNVIIMGWVNLALSSILEVYFDLNRETALLYVAGCMVLTAIYASFSGLKGVLVTDAFQFGLAMAGCIILAFIVLDLPAVGGMNGLTQKLAETGRLDFFPAFDGQGLFSLTAGTFIAFLGIQWWASWYPGAEPGGGGYVAQRMLSCRTQQDALAATFLFQLAHYALRPWPWIVVGLATVVLYPDLAANDYRKGYVLVMRDFLPIGLQGLLLAAFLAAYMSTLTTQLNWGVSYLINDGYKPLSANRHSEKDYIFIARVTTIILMLVSLGVSFVLESISEAWAFVIECGAGYGLVLILRWYWWRVSAYSELAGLIAPFLAYGGLKFGAMQGILDADVASGASAFMITTAFTTVTWIVVTYLTPPTTTSTLHNFYRTIKPLGWWPFPPYSEQTEKVWVLALCWFSGILFVYGILFGVGYALFGNLSVALFWFFCSIGSGLALFFMNKKFKVF